MISINDLNEVIVIQKILHVDANDGGKWNDNREDVIKVYAKIEELNTKEMMKLGRVESSNVVKVTMYNTIRITDNMGFKLVDQNNYTLYYRFISLPSVIKNTISTSKASKLNVNGNMFMTILAESEVLSDVIN